MGNKILELVFSLSVSGTMVALLLLLLKPVTARVFSRRWQYYVWMIVILRLMIPFAPEKNLTQALFDRVSNSAAVLFQSGSSESQIPESLKDTVFDADSSTENGNGITGPEKLPGSGAPNNSGTDGVNFNDGVNITDGINAADSINISDGNNIADGNLNKNTDNKAGRGARILSVLFFIWLFGISIFLAFAAADYRNFIRYVKANNRKEEDERVLELLDDVMMELGIRNRIEIYENHLILSPLTTGFFRIMLVLPETLPIDEMLKNGSLRYILMHELTHVKKKDLWYKWLFQIVLCIHWFNPVLYLVREELNRSCELACDEAVLGGRGDEERRIYGNTLLAAAESAITYKNNVMSTTLVEEKRYMKERILMIMKNKKNTKAAVFCSTAAMCAILLFGCAAGASVNSGGNGKQNIGQGTALGEIPGGQTAPEVMKTSVSGADDHNVKNITTKAPEVTAPAETKSGGSNILNGSKEITSEENRKNAEQIYDSDTLIAGEDRTSNFSCWSYMTKGDGNVDIARLKFTGSTTMLCVYASEETEIPVEYEAYQKNGSVKLVVIGPDDKVTVIAENTVDLTTKVTLKKGRNRIKLVGKDGEVVALSLKFGEMKAGSYTALYYSEWEEQAAKLKEEVKKGGKIDIDKFIRLAPEMDCEDVSELLGQLLDQNAALTSEQLAKLAGYSDEDVLGEYLMKRKANGKEVNFDTFAAMAPYLDDTLVGQYMMDYLKADKKLTKEQIKKVLYYADEDVISEYMKQSIQSGETFNLDELSELSEYLYPDTLAECVLALMDRKDMDSLAVLKKFADDMYADDNYNCMIKLIRSGTKVKAQDIIDFADQLYSEDLAGCVEEAMTAGTVFTVEEIKKISDDLYSSDLGGIVHRMLAAGIKFTYDDMLVLQDDLYTTDLDSILTIMVDGKMITSEQRKKMLYD